MTTLAKVVFLNIRRWSCDVMLILVIAREVDLNLKMVESNAIRVAALLLQVHFDLSCI